MQSKYKPPNSKFKLVFTGKYFKPILDWFIPKELEVNNDPGGLDQMDQHPTAQLIVTVFLISIIGSISQYFNFTSLSSSPENQLSIIVVTLGVAACLFIGVLLFKFYFQTLTFISNFYAAISLLSTTGAIFIMGGSWDAPNLPLLIIVPTWAFLLCGKNHGYFWLFAVFIVLAALYFLEPLGIQFIQIVPAEELNYAKFMAWVSTFFLLTVCLYAFRHNYSTLSDFLAWERGQFAYQAQHDQLTGLANRELFNKRTEDALSSANKKQLQTAVLFIDLDNFKPINDTLGHKFGDNALQVVASRILSNVRSSDTVARIGGDEFTVVLNGVTDRATMMQVSEKIQRSLRAPISLNGKTYNIGASIGISVAPEQGSDADTLVRLADTAMYQAKRIKNHISFYEP